MILLISEFEGYPLERLFELSPLADLVRLSLPLSLNSCIMNMPEVVLILTEFKSLRSLVLSWGMFNMSNMSGRIQVNFHTRPGTKYVLKKDKYIQDRNVMANIKYHMMWLIVNWMIY